MSWAKTLAHGPLLIHAGDRWCAESHNLAHSGPFYRALDSIGQAPQAFGYPADVMPFGALVGMVDVLGVLGTNRLKWQPGSRYFAFDQFAGQLVVSDDEKAFGDFTEGRIAVLLGNPRAFRRPIPHGGRRTVFDVPEKVFAQQLAFAVGQHHLDKTPVKRTIPANPSEPDQ